jgi:magnesium-transporting ATPase (P-type)
MEPKRQALPKIPMDHSPWTRDTVTRYVTVAGEPLTKFQYKLVVRASIYSQQFKPNGEYKYGEKLTGWEKDLVRAARKWPIETNIEDIEGLKRSKSPEARMGDEEEVEEQKERGKSEEMEGIEEATEIAIQVFAARFGMIRNTLTTGDAAQWTDLVELPFDSDVKRMSVIMGHHSGEQYAFTKGAVERVIQSCTTYFPKDSSEPVDITPFRDEILRNMEVLASLGLRVLALASKRFTGKAVKGDEVDRKAVESDLVFRGLIGLYDPPRPESAPAVRQCHEAGIEVHMLTGDHPETAKAIAIEVGILPSADRMRRIASDVSKSLVMTATEFDDLSDDQVDALRVLPLVVARCAPSTKVRMIEALHRRGRFCAMVSELFVGSAISYK